MRASEVKRFAVFSGENFYPCGGWEDKKLLTDSLLGAFRLAEELGSHPYLWSQIVDLHRGDMIVAWENGTRRHVEGYPTAAVAYLKDDDGSFPTEGD